MSRILQVHVLICIMPTESWHESWHESWQDLGGNLGINLAIDLGRNLGKLIKLTFFVPFTKNGKFKLTKCGLSPKGFCILRSVTRIMVKTYNYSCNRKMYVC